jgi:hypothetical protein
VIGRGLRLWQHRPTLVATALIAGLAVVFYAPLLLGLRTFPDGDFTHHFLPFSIFQQEQLAALRLPLWNPFTYSGHPFLADTQAAVFYPPSNLLLLLTMPWHDAAARLYFLQVEAVVHVILAGVFTYLLLVDLTRVRWAGLLAAITFAFSGYLTGYPPLQLAILRSAIWLPLILLLMMRAIQHPRQLRWWIGAALALSCAFLAGHPQTFLHIAYVSAAWGMTLTWSTWRAPRSETSSLRPTPQHLSTSTPYPYLIGASLLLALFFGLTAAQWLPSIEFSRLSVRANTDYAFVSGGFPLQDTWQVLLPGVLSSFSPLYVGVVALGLVCVAIASWGRGVRDWRLEIGSAQRTTVSNLQSPISNTLLTFFICLALIALLLSYGGNSFLYPFFYRVAPGWNLFRGQERAAFLVAFALSGLAGLGAAAVYTLPLLARRRSALIYGALAIGGVYIFGMLWQLPGRGALGNGIYLLIAAGTLLLAMSTALSLWLPGWSRRRSALLLTLTTVNLFAANIGANLDAFGPARKTILAPEVVALQDAVAEQSGANLGLPGRVYNEFRAYEDYGIRQHLEDAWGSSPLRLARYALLFDAFPLDRLWRLTGVEHLLTWRRELFEPSTLLGEFPQASDATYLHRLSEANPRAWLASTVQVASDDQALQLLADHGFDIERSALLPPESAANPQSLASGESTVQLARPAPNRLRVQVQSEHGGLLVVSENWMPGWRVEAVESEQSTVNSEQLGLFGLPAFSVQRADLAFVGVPIPAGSHSFDLVYWPQSVRVGLWISGVTLVALLVLAVLWLMRRGAGGKAAQ